MFAHGDPIVTQRVVIGFRTIITGTKIVVGFSGFILLSLLAAAVGVPANTIFDVEGTVSRELPTSGYPDFLPEQVVPYLSKGAPISVKPDPIYEVAHGGVAVGWHPTDPNRFVVYSRKEGLIFWSLENGEPEITARVPATFTVDSPIGRLLYWIPEENLVGTYINGFESIELLPTLTADGNLENYVHCERSRDILSIKIRDNNSLLVTLPFDIPANDCLLTSDFQQLILRRSNSNDASILDLETLQLSPSVEDRFNADTSDCLVAWSNLYQPNTLLTRADTGEEVTRLWTSSYAVAFSSDGKYLATVSGPKVQIWDVSEFCEG